MVDILERIDSLQCSRSIPERCRWAMWLSVTARRSMWTVSFLESVFLLAEVCVRGGVPAGSYGAVT